MPGYKKTQAGQAIGQILSYIVTPGGLIMMKKFKPGVLKKVSDVLKKYFVIPYIGLLEPVIGVIMFDKEDKEHWREIRKAPVTERAEFISSNMAKYVVGTGLSLGTSLGAKIATDKVLNAPGEWGLLFKSSGVDAGVKIGGVAVLSSILSKPTNKAKRALSKVLQKVGVEKENADDAAMAALFIGIPDTAGFFAANYYIKREGAGLSRPSV